MSTQINVTVGSGGLSDKARQLQTAARQAQLEKERQQRIEAQGQEQRTANLAAAGRAPDGTPLFGPGFKQPEIERRPAASRQESTKVGHAWFQTNSSFETILYPGLVVSGGQNSVTTGASFFIARGQNNLTLRAGDGLDSQGIETFQYTIPEPSTDGYEWNPSISAFFYNSAWFPYAYGPRTARWNASHDTIATTLQLPAGKDSFVLLVFFIDLEYSINVTAPCYATSSSISGDINNPPSQEFLDSPFSSLRLPGAQVGIGYATDVTGSPVHPFDLPSANVHQRGERANLAFLCTNKSIKPINISSTLEQFMNWVNPAFTTTTVPIKLFSFDEFSVEVPVSQNNSNTIAGLSRTTGFVSSVVGPARVTPEIYQSLNNVYPYTSPSNIITYDSIKDRLSTDTRSGVYSTSDNRYASSLAFNYAKNSKLQPQSELGRKVFSLLLNPSRPPANIADYYAVWDWDNPSYCRARLADLGISSADLES